MQSGCLTSRPTARNRHPFRLFTSATTTIAVFSFAASVVPVLGDWQSEIGYTQLQERLGAAVPRGSAIPVSQIEMGCNDEGDYLPDPTDAQFAGKSLSNHSGLSGVSLHATTVAQYYFGLTSSICPGIRSIAVYDAKDWAGDGALKLSSASEPMPESHLVENHSWIGSYGVESIDTEALRRVDHMVVRDGVVVVAGVKNGTGTPMPSLMCSGYNVVSVGLTSARSSFGPTRVEGRRVKPDLVAPLSATSWATPVVSACASLLVESLEEGGYLRDLQPERQRSARALVCKALLMGGATKDEWKDWRKGFDQPVTDGTVPLDYRYGAGELNIDNSHRLLASGQRHPDPSARVPLMGWSFARANVAEPHRYIFQLPAGRTGLSASVLLTWHRNISVADGRRLGFTPILANMNLRLLRMNNAGASELVDASVSTVDNVEHVFLRGLRSGRYLIEVDTDRPADYCLTWDVRPDAPSQRRDVLVSGDQQDAPHVATLISTESSR